MPDAHSNFGYALVATAPAPALTGLSLSVAAGYGALFPAAPFNCTVFPPNVQPISTNAEIVRVTAVAGDVFTITRAQESSTAMAIAAGWQIANTITVKVLTDVEGDLVTHEADTTNVHGIADTANLLVSGGPISATSINKVAITAPATSATLTIADGKTLTVNGSITLEGTETIYLKAADFIPRTTTGCGINSTESATNKINLDLLEFDAATSEYAQIDFVLPKEWNAGTLTAKFHWTAASGSGTVIFGIQAVSLANDDAIDTAFGTAQTATDTLLTALDMHISPATSAMTVAGTVAAGNPVTFQVYRDISDTLAVDAQLIGVTLTYTKS